MELLSVFDARGAHNQNAENIVFAHDEELCAVDLSVTTGVFPEKDAVADFHIQVRKVAIVQPLATPHGDYFTFLRLFLSRIGNDYAVARGFLLLDSLHDDAVI